MISSGAQGTSHEFFCCACTHKLQVPCAVAPLYGHRMYAFFSVFFSRAHYQGRSFQVRNSHTLGKRFLSLIKGLGKFLFLLFCFLSKGTQNIKSKFWTNDYSTYTATHLFCTTKFFSKNTYFLPSASSSYQVHETWHFRGSSFYQRSQLTFGKV